MKKIIACTIASLLSLAWLTAAAQPAEPNDAQIAGIVVTADAVDIDASKMAQKKSSNKDVKQFARQMVADHGGVSKRAIALAKKLKVTPEDSDVSKSLKSGGDANMAKLKGLKGKQFDQAYIDNEVSYHEAVINAMDKTLVPSAQNAELRDLLVKTRPVFAAHLEHAKQVQASLK